MTCGHCHEPISPDTDEDRAMHFQSCAKTQKEIARCVAGNLQILKTATDPKHRRELEALLVRLDYTSLTGDALPLDSDGRDVL